MSGLESLASHMRHFCVLEISQKKLVVPSTKVTCLGVLIDTKSGNISIPDAANFTNCTRVVQQKSLY